MKFLKSVFDYITTIIFTTINIIVVSLTLKHAESTVAQELAMSITIRKVLLVINIGYLVAFLFIGFPKYYKGNTKKNFQFIVNIVKTAFSLINAYIVITVNRAAVAVLKEENALEGVGFLKKWKLINATLKPIGINGFYVFFMYMTLLICAIKILVWIIKLIVFIFKPKGAKAS